MRIDKNLRSLSHIGEVEEWKNEELRLCLSNLRFPATKQEVLIFSQIHCPRFIKNSLKGALKTSFNNLGEVEENVL